jgi:hypothetical protein
LLYILVMTVGTEEIRNAVTDADGKDPNQPVPEVARAPISPRALLGLLVHPKSEREGSAPFDREHFLRDNPVSRIASRIPADHWKEGPRRTPLGSISTGNSYDWDPKPELLESSLISPVYGERAVGEGENLHVEVTKGLADLTAINIALQKEVLVDEGGLIPVTLLPPNLREELSVENNDRWLLEIKGGIWPVMVHEKEDFANPGEFKLEVSDHDLGDYHLGNMALFPRELNTQIVEAAGYELDRRLERLTDPKLPKGLVLPNEDPRAEDPLAWSPRGSIYHNSHSGIDEIDNVSDSSSYQSLLAHLAVLPKQEREEIFALALRFAKLPLPYDQRNTEIDKFVTEHFSSDDEKEQVVRRLESMASDLLEQRLMIVSITNFNMRHREGRNMTPDEQEKAKDGYMQGILRVAGKLHGDEEALPRVV